MAEPVKPRRSRTAWPGPMSIAGLGEGHDHQLPDRLIKRVRLLTQAVFIIGFCVVAIGTLILLIILERSAYRDDQTANVREEIRDSWCKALDGLPEGGLLDRLRADYNCGPGIPLEELPEDIRRRYQPEPERPVQAAPAAPTTQAPLGAPARPNPPRGDRYRQPPTTAEPTTAPAASTAPTSSPENPATPVIEGVCQLVNVCLEENP